MSVEFEYVSELVDEFFCQKKIGNSLSIIEQNEITGWEVWLQIELSHFLSQHHSMPEWWREWPVDFDRRIEKTRTFFRPDFIIRKKGWRKESYVALELKQHPDAGSCFANMLKDIQKVGKARPSSLDIRRMFSLGVHRRKPNSELRDLIVSRFEAAGMEPPTERMVIRYIPGSKYAYSLFLI